MSTNAQEHAMISPTDIFRPLRELAHRSADGIDITLMWNPADDRAFVVVVDLKAGTMFEVGVEDANPMHVSTIRTPTPARISQPRAIPRQALRSAGVASPASAVCTARTPPASSE